MRSIKLSFCIFFIMVGSVFVQAQVPQSDTQIFSSGDISFSYPSSWKVQEKASPSVQQVNIVPDRGNVLIVILVSLSQVSDEETFDAYKDQITKVRVGNIASGFASYKESGECIQFRDKKIPGQTLTGIYGKEPTTNSSFSMVIDKKFINLIYLREDRASAIADNGWRTILDTLTIKGGDPKGSIMFDTESDEVLNGKALKLPKPSPPSWVKYPETITVRIVIDEAGDVISAKASAGNPEYRSASENAAKRAKFSPTKICGELTKVSGQVTYRFLQ